MTLVRICRTDEVPEGEIRRFELDHRPFAVANLGDEGFRDPLRFLRSNGDGTYYATSKYVDVNSSVSRSFLATALKSTAAL